MTDVPSLRVAVLPDDPSTDTLVAVRAGGGEVVPITEARAIVMARGDVAALTQGLEQGRQVSWVQLPSAGIERYTNLLDDARVWTCAKGIYGPAVAEHALALVLAGIHQIPHFVRSRSWSSADYRPLLGASVLIVGGGGITRALIALLQPFGVRSTVIRRHVQPMQGAEQVLAASHLHTALPDADVLILAPALTAETRGMIGPDELQHMKSTAWLVNVGRGALVQTAALVSALREHQIGGAALDVTDPEPLPDGHPLWGFDNCLITPHVANPPIFERQAYAQLVEENVRRRRLGHDLLGQVDTALGY